MAKLIIVIGNLRTRPDPSQFPQWAYLRYNLSPRPWCDHARSVSALLLHAAQQVTHHGNLATAALPHHPPTMTDLPLPLSPVTTFRPGPKQMVWSATCSRGGVGGQGGGGKGGRNTTI